MQQQQPEHEDLVLQVLNFTTTQREDGAYDVVLETTRGPIQCELFLSEGSPGAVIWSAIGRPGPTNTRRRPVYVDIPKELAQQGITSLRVYFRFPGAEWGPFEECVLDLQAGVSFLKAMGARAIALVGHSFSAAAVIKAGTLNPNVSAVVAMASQLYGTREVDKLSPRPLLLIHGTNDAVLEHTASEIIYSWAKEPKEFILIQGADHGFRETPDQINELLRTWLPRFVGPQAFTVVDS